MSVASIADFGPSGSLGVIGAGDYMYYRQPNGWITASPVGKEDLRKMRYQAEGWVPLESYGRFHWYPYLTDHPFEVLFQRGGAKELPADQVIQNGLHLNPPNVPGCGHAWGLDHRRATAGIMGERGSLGHGPGCGFAPAAFPQVPDPPPALDCDHCGRTFYVERARAQHTGVMHRDVTSAAAMSNAIVAGLGAVLGPQTAATASTTAALAPAHAERLPYACGYCDESFRSPVQLSGHLKQTHPRAA